MAVAAPLAMASQKMAGKIPSIDFVAVSCRDSLDSHPIILLLFDNENCMKHDETRIATQGLANLLSCAKAALLTICLAAFKTAEV